MEDICQAIYDACLFSISHPLQAFEGWLVSLKENADHKIISRSHWIPAKNFISIFQYLSYSKRHLNYLAFYPEHALEMSVICSPESWFILWNKQTSEHFLELSHSRNVNCWNFDFTMWVCFLHDALLGSLLVWCPPYEQSFAIQLLYSIHAHALWPEIFMYLNSWNFTVDSSEIR